MLRDTEHTERTESAHGVLQGTIKIMQLFISLLLAFLPSIIWLALFLREDVHPEPNPHIIRVFAAGMLVTIPTIAVEAFASCIIRGLGCPSGAALANTFAVLQIPFEALGIQGQELIFIFAGIGLVEEAMKYAAVHFSVLHRKAFNEPIDAVLYMIIAALGFAAVENALLVSNADIQASSLFAAGGVVDILGARSFSAVLLHALASGIIGFGLARSFFSRRPHLVFLGTSVLVAALIHGVYDGVVGGLVFSGEIVPTIASTVALLIVTGIVLLGMIQYLRRMSEKTRWVNTGDAVAHEIN